MRITACKITLCAACTWSLTAAQAGPGAAGPSALAPVTPIIQPQDRAYGGEIQLTIDASDTARRIVRVHETLTGVGPNTVLLYPKWLPGTHAPEGTIDRIAGIRISAQGAPVSWKRDPVDVFALRLQHLSAGIHSLDIDFDYLSPTSAKVGLLEMSPDMLMIEWNELVFYPAGYYARQIPAQVHLALPAAWQFGSALEIASTDGAQTHFQRTTLETLIDSPVYAGRYASRLDLDPGAAAPVHMDLFADRPMEDQRKRIDLLNSIGVEIEGKDGKEGTLSQVIWDSAAFKAKLTEGAQILAINGIAYDADVLKDAIRAARGGKEPIQLIFKNGDRFLVANIDYHDGLRYPHLEREGTEPARLDAILSARP